MAEPVLLNRSILIIATLYLTLLSNIHSGPQNTACLLSTDKSFR